MLFRQLRFEGMRNLLLWRRRRLDEPEVRELSVALARRCGKDISVVSEFGDAEDSRYATTNDGEQHETPQLDFLFAIRKPLPSIYIRFNFSNCTITGFDSELARGVRLIRDGDLRRHE